MTQVEFLHLNKTDNHWWFSIISFYMFSYRDLQGSTKRNRQVSKISLSLDYSSSRCNRLKSYWNLTSCLARFRDSSSKNFRASTVISCSSFVFLGESRSGPEWAARPVFSWMTGGTERVISSFGIVIISWTYITKPVVRHQFERVAAPLLVSLVKVCVVQTCQYEWTVHASRSSSCRALQLLDPGARRQTCAKDANCHHQDRDRLWDRKPGSVGRLVDPRKYESIGQQTSART